MMFDLHPLVNSYAIGFIGRKGGQHSGFIAFFNDKTALFSEMPLIFYLKNLSNNKQQTSNNKRFIDSREADRGYW